MAVILREDPKERFVKSIYSSCTSLQARRALRVYDCAVPVTIVEGSYVGSEPAAFHFKPVFDLHIARRCRSTRPSGVKRGRGELGSVIQWFATVYAAAPADVASVTR